MNENARAKILYLFDVGDWQSRMPLALAAQAQGYDVRIVLIGGAQGTQLPNASLLAAHLPSPAGVFRGRDLPHMINAIRRVIAAENPALVHTVTLKYAFITGLAVLPLKRLRRIYTLAGLGYIFRGDNRKSKVLRGLLSPFLRLIFKNPQTTLIFQNPDDRALLIQRGLAAEQRSVLIRGSGVDLSVFTATPPPEDDAPLVLMPTRLVREKGVHIFAEAARILKERGAQARFQIAGGLTQHNPQALSLDEMTEFVKQGHVEWLGRIDDMPALLARASIVVYPSYYGEGIPRVLLEAAAAGRPIITTDHPGCREAVREGQNGFLVPVKDADATASTIVRLLNDPALRLSMGAQSRALAEEEFDINLINRQTLDVYKATLGHGKL
jgi:glycosyltransferase involved in cell wall biosynthesis